MRSTSAINMKRHLCKHHEVTLTLQGFYCRDCDTDMNMPHSVCQMFEKLIDANESLQSQITNLTNAICNHLKLEPCQYCGKYGKPHSAECAVIAGSFVCPDCIPRWYEESADYDDQALLDASMDDLFIWIAKNGLASRFPYICKENPAYKKVYNSIAR